MPVFIDVMPFHEQRASFQILILNFVRLNVNQNDDPIHILKVEQSAVTTRCMGIRSY